MEQSICVATKRNMQARQYVALVAIFDTIPHSLSLCRPGLQATRTKCVPFIFIFDKAKIFHFTKHQIANGGRV